MPYTPPWIVPADVIRSASAGASAGLSARAHDLQAAAQEQAAEEFIARLNQQASQFSQNLASQHDIATSRLAQALRAQDALDVYHKGELDVRNKEAATHAAKLLADNSFEPASMTKDGTKMMQVSKGRWQILPAEFNGEQIDIGGEKYVRTSPNHLQKVTPNQATNPEAIIAKGTFNEALKGSDEEKLKAAEDALRRALSPPGTYRQEITPERRGPETFWTKHLGTEPEIIPATTNWVRNLQPTNAPAAITATTKALTEDIARQLLEAAGGDKAKARQMAKDQGFDF